MNFIENKDKKCPGARRTFSLLFCQTSSLNFRLFCDNPCYSNINPGAFQNLSALSEQNRSLIANKSLWYWFLKSCVSPKNLKIISHGLEITFVTFCCWIKRASRAEKLSSLGPASLKILFWSQDWGLRAGTGGDWDWVIKLIMPGWWVLVPPQGTTQALETSG